MIVVHETLQVTGQVPFAEYDDVVQALGADGADGAFDISPLPGQCGADSTCVIPMNLI
jgi:hypothetical protein